MLNIVNKLFGSVSKRHLKSFSKIIHKINEFEPEFKNLSNTDLQAKTDYFKKLIDEIVENGFELIGEPKIKGEFTFIDAEKARKKRL